MSGGVYRGTYTLYKLAYTYKKTYAIFQQNKAVEVLLYTDNVLKTHFIRIIFYVRVPEPMYVFNESTKRAEGCVRIKRLDGKNKNVFIKNII